MKPKFSGSIFKKPISMVLSGLAAIAALSCGAPPPPPQEPSPPPIPEKAKAPEAAAPKAEASKEGGIEALARQSESVIIGKVQKNQSKWAGGKIVTISEVTPIEVLKGSRNESPVPVMFLGGTVGTIRQDFSGEIALSEGETAVLFLKHLSAQGGASELSKELRILHRIPLLAPFERDSRLKNNRRIAEMTKEIAALVRKGAN